MSALTDLQRLALAEAMSKVARGETDPRGGAHGEPTLRTAADDALREAYEAEGTDRRRITINGVEVGTLSARISKPSSTTSVVVSDPGALVAWLRESDGGLDALERLVASSPAAVVSAATADGELPDGCATEAREEPARWLGTTLRVRAEDVARALGPSLRGEVAGMLGGSE